MNNQVDLTEKTARLAKLLETENLGGVLLNAQHNFAWLTGGKNNAVNQSAENGACYLLVRNDGKRFILASKIEMARMLAEEVSADDFEPIEFSWENEKASGDFIFEKAKSLLSNNSSIATDLLLNPNFRSIENLIARCRYQLTKTEIEDYRLLGKDAGEIVGDLAQTLKPNESEIEISQKVKTALALRNINSIVTLIAADERIKQFRHPVPTEKRWQKTLLIAVCAKRKGLIASFSRIVVNGNISEDLRHRTDATDRVYAKILNATKIGANGAEIFKTISEAYKFEGFTGEEHLHHQGGACGYKGRDWVAHPKCGEIVQPNQAFAWNPTITGSKVEETCIVSENGVEILTTSSNFPSNEAEVNGQSILLPDILCI